MVAILGFSKDQVTAAVQAMYADLAGDPRQHFHFPVGRSAARAVGYPEETLEQLPEAAVTRFVGVGFPFRAGVVREGDTVLDIGAGAGCDTLIASSLVGENGKVWALDITTEMLDQLQTTLTQAGIRNVELVEADAERIPLPNHSVDVVTSNGVLNLIPDKRRVLSEIFRVLKPEGRVQLSDIVIDRPVPLGGRSDPELWAECVVGASIKEDYLALFQEAGFTDISELREFDYFAESPSADTRRIANGLGARSIDISMQRPAQALSPGYLGQLARRLHPRRLTRIGARGLWGAVAAAAAVFACYGLVALFGLLSLMGLSLTLPEGLWAFAILAAAVLAVAATALNLPRHGRPWPLLATGIGAVLIAYALFVSYDPLLEALGFVVLVGAIGWDLYQVYLAECIPEHRRRLRQAKA
ncbi:MerC family mercury resistance protein [Fodinicurvata sediminis]|uniref:MerC family mercury resistance protein n=1 Tax=Fodinicurvata sediminis TaxID=1121832 RepID=UPI0003B77DED|nr:MerC family mercury resistance protein [Fodinicurvata sediminis]